MVSLHEEQPNGKYKERQDTEGAHLSPPKRHTPPVHYSCVIK